MDAPNHPSLQPGLVYYAVPMLVMPTSASASKLAARNRGNTPRHQPYVRKPIATRPKQTSSRPAPIPLPWPYGVVPQPQALIPPHLRLPLYAPPHPLDPKVAIHPPLSPREIFTRQQERQRRRLEALFCIPQFKKVVWDGFAVAMMEARASKSNNATELHEGTSKSASN
ncbi:hypothetical protein H0H92_001140 [Tricholoma furcatifolium]|nr:hypothetical protein H0H92_001140 [Tricholoma furcatifolium]